jgi:hypothetical protein
LVGVGSPFAEAFEETAFPVTPMSSLDQNRLLPEPHVESDPILPAIAARRLDAPLDGTGQTLIASAAPVILFADELMAEGQTTSPEAPATGGIVCPFCAHVRADSVGSCPRCTMEDTPSTRRSTGERIGPWFVLQRKNPTAPGLRLSVLLTLARRGHVTAKSIVRGPTTGQFWRYASQVKGLSRVFGLCWHCGASVSPDATTCPKCRSAQEIPDDPDQFLESHAALPVMREIPARELDGPDEMDGRSERTLPSARRELTDMRAPLGSRELAAPSRSAPGTRSVTLARGDDDVILSASELAAAFQLDMPRQGLVKRTSRGLWRATKVAAILAILLAGGTATAFYIKPEWYQQARALTLPYIEKGQSFANRILGSQPKKSSTLEDLTQLPPITPIELSPVTANVKTSDTSISKTSKEDEVPLPAPLPKSKSSWNGSLSSTPSVVDANAAIDALGGGTSVFVPTTRPAATPSQAITEFPTIVDSILARSDAAKPNEPANAAPPNPSPTSKAPAPAAVSTASMTIEEAIAAAATLRTSALDAEARKDWAAAVLIYEQIAKLPEGAHPSDLKVKLAVARDRAKS